MRDSIEIGLGRSARRGYALSQVGIVPSRRTRDIDAVSLDDIQSVAQTIVDPESLSLTMLGNLKKPGISTEMLREAIA